VKLEKWAEKLNKEVYNEWKENCSKWKPGFKIFYSPIHKNPSLMILTLNPGGNGKHFRNEDLPKFEKRNFSVQNFHSYVKPRDPNNKMARAVKAFFENDDLLAKSIPIPILFFRSKDYKHWKKNFSRKYSDNKRKQVENFCYDKVNEILKKLDPNSILIVGTKTYDILIKNSRIELKTIHVETGEYGNRKERIYIKAEWNGKPVFCIRHLTGARTKNDHLQKMKEIFFRDMLKFS